MKLKVSASPNTSCNGYLFVLFYITAGAPPLSHGRPRQAAICFICFVNKDLIYLIRVCDSIVLTKHNNEPTALILVESGLHSAPNE